MRTRVLLNIFFTALVAGALHIPYAIADKSVRVPVERITYTLKMNVLPVGQAVFTQLPAVKEGKQLLSHVTFETRATNFHDLEDIYSDPQTHLPVKISRSIKTLTGREQIVEVYDQKNCTVTITKSVGKKTEQQVIKKKGPIQNTILLPFTLRQIPTLAVGWHARARFPTQEFELSVVRIEHVRVPAGKFRCYHFVSKPDRVQVWVTADERRIPVKIIGASGIGYSMLLQKYEGKKP